MSNEKNSDVGKEEIEHLNDSLEYIVIDMIDYGSFGDVLKVKDESNNAIYAMKQIKYRGNFQDDPCIISEIYCLTHLKHKNIIRMHEILIDSGEIQIIMEYAQRENLERYMDQNEHIEFHHKYKIYSQILEGIKYCHSVDIAHRDITPVNILLTEDYVVKIADFGLAVKCFDDDGKPMLCTDYLGRASYLPPEVLSQKPFLPKPADIWSIGVTLLYLLFHSIPFKGFHPEILEDQLNHTWTGFIHDFCEKNGCRLKVQIIDIIESLLQIESNKRRNICDLVRSWHEVSPEELYDKSK
ncbi:hypothetical protein ACF0H5_001591 [Mactra antiquata]